MSGEMGMQIQYEKGKNTNEKDLIGKFVNVKITEISEYDMIGKIVQEKVH